EAYGQTESTDGVTMARGTSVFDREGTVGRVNPHVVVAVRRPDGALAAPGEEGEIVVGGPTVMAGYHRDRAATADAVRDGWRHTEFIDALPRNAANKVQAHLLRERFGG